MLPTNTAVDTMKVCFMDELASTNISLYYITWLYKSKCNWISFVLTQTVNGFLEHKHALQYARIGYVSMFLGRAA